MLVVFGAYAATALLVPTLAPIATTDDWGYARSVEILSHEHRLEIFQVVAATAVFQVAWGALFATLFEPTLGAVRLSTLVMSALGGWALYGILRRLGVSRPGGALGTAAYLFNPLSFVLAHTFMTDPHFVALLLVSTYFYLGDAGSDAGGWHTIAGSAVAALAFLTRQQGALIPLAVATVLLLNLRPLFDRAALQRLCRIGAIPTLAMAGYYLWLSRGPTEPEVQASFLREATSAGWGATWFLVRRLTFVETMYLGFFALPIVAAALPALRRLRPPRSWVGQGLVLAWGAVVLVGAGGAWQHGGRMPYVGQFFGAGGLGAPDVLGSRPRLLNGPALAAMTVTCGIASILYAYLLARRVAAKEPERPAAGRGAGLVLSLALWQVVGVLPPSYHYLNRGGSLDRYLLPLLPLGLCLALWALRDARLSLPLGSLVVVAFAIFAVAGTRDYLVYMGGVWEMARGANAAGVPNDRLDAGSGWDGYHLYEYSRDNVPHARTVGGPWWVYFYAKATDSAYVVSGRRLDGYVELRRRSYSSWLEREPTFLYLLRRPDAPWPLLPPSPPPAARPVPLPVPPLLERRDP